jgi:hypothetical protein
VPSLWRTNPKRHQRAVTASGTVVDLTDRNLVNTLSHTRMSWQADAWRYRDLIGELGAALRLKANITSKVSFVAAAVSDGDDEPHILTTSTDTTDTADPPPVPEHVVSAAIDCLTRLPFESGYAFQGMISQGFDVAGECWLHGYPDDDGDEQWEVLSTSEVVPSIAGLGIVTVPGMPARPLNPDTEALIRLWVPKPEWKQLADSPMRMMLDVCEDIVLAGREIRAAALSRIAANGVVLVPNELSMPMRENVSLTPENDAFAAGFQAAIVTPISNEGHAGAVAPIVLRGEPEDLKEFRHVTFARETSPELVGKMQAALIRLADSLDLPPEAMKGVGTANHWTAWLIDAATFKNHIEPSVRMIVDSITESFYRRTLVKDYGLTKDEALSVRIWYQAGNITENANRSKDADDAMTHGAISYKAYRDAKGFSDEDAPGEEDLQRLAVVNARMDPVTMTQLASIILGTKTVFPARDTVGGTNDQVGQTPSPAQIGPGAGPGQTPTQPVPTAGAPAARVAAGVPPRIITGHALAEIDQALRERLRQAGDDAVLRALEKAGSRIKAKAQGDKALAAQLTGMDPTEVGPKVGAARLTELGLTEDVLLGLAFTYLGGKFVQWTMTAVKAAVKVVAELAELPLTMIAHLTQTMTARIPGGWQVLEHALRERALAKLYGRGGDELRGEVPDSVVMPGDIRDALSHIGGGGGGIGLGGDVLRAVDHRASRLGFTWRYGITPRERAFEPHAALAGKRFAGFDDPALSTVGKDAWVGPYLTPGDHRGCLCDYVPAWLLEPADTLARVVVGEESPGMAGDRVLAELDDVAGRLGTHSQRTRDERDRMVTVQNQWLSRESG